MSDRCLRVEEPLEDAPLDIGEVVYVQSLKLSRERGYAVFVPEADIDAETRQAMILQRITREEGERLRRQVGGWLRRVTMCWFGHHAMWWFSENSYKECLRCGKRSFDS